jgi:hypothetical protein
MNNLAIEPQLQRPKRRGHQADYLIMRNRVLLAQASAARARQTQIVQAAAAKQALSNHYSLAWLAENRWSRAPARDLHTENRGRQTPDLQRIYGNDAMFHGISALMLLELAYDLTAFGLHDFARRCRVEAAGSRSVAVAVSAAGWWWPHVLLLGDCAPPVAP